MADVATKFATLSNDAPNVWIAQEMFQLLEKRLVVGSFAKMHRLPQRMGTSLRVVRYKRLNLPTKPLTEGIPPDAVALSTENVDVTVEQWGIVALLTDVAQITTKHPALRIAIDRTGTAMAECLEREMYETLLGGTNTFFGGAAVNRAALDNTKKLGTSDILSVLANLRTTGAPEMAGGLFGGIMHPNQEADLLAVDTIFKDLSSFANVKRFDFGQIGVWMGVNWRRSNFVPVLKGVAAPDGNAPDAEKGKIVLSGAGGPFANTDVVNVVIVAREVATDYERKISQEGTVTITASDEDVIVTTPTSTNYVYDIYVSDADASTTHRLAFTGVPANTAKTLTGFQVTGAVNPAPPAATVEVFTAWIFGEDAFGRVELSGMSLQSFITPAGASFSNPLAQGRKVGSKIMWKSFIIDGAFMARIETGSAFGAGLPA